MSLAFSALSRVNRHRSCIPRKCHITSMPVPCPTELLPPGWLPYGLPDDFASFTTESENVFHLLRMSSAACFLLPPASASCPCPFPLARCLLPTASTPSPCSLSPTSSTFLQNRLDTSARSTGPSPSSLLGCICPFAIHSSWILAHP